MDEVISFILPKYPATSDPRSKAPPVTEEENLADIQLILTALQTSAPEKKVLLETQLSATRFIQTLNPATGSRAFRTATESYVPVETLRMYFEANPDAWFISSELSAESVDALVRLGVSRAVRIHRRPLDWSLNVTLASERGYHRRGLAGFDPDASIDGLAHALANITLEKAVFIWNTLILPHAAQVRGTVESASRQDYTNSTKQEQSSVFGELVRTLPWIPDRNEAFHVPNQLEPDGLHPSLTLNDALLLSLGVKPGINEQALRELGLEGLDRADLQILREEAESFKEWLDERRRSRSEVETEGASDDGRQGADYESLFKDAFARPNVAEGSEDVVEPSPVANPARYRRNLAAELAEAKSDEPVQARFSRVPRRVWEAKDKETRTFLREEYGGQCQICGETFLKRDGEPYFEGVYLVSRTGARWLDRPGNILCLCATCTAKFEHGSVEADDAVEQILEFKTSGEGNNGDLSIGLRLCGVGVELTFSERHLLRLQTLLTDQRPD